MPRAMAALLRDGLDNVVDEPTAVLFHGNEDSVLIVGVDLDEVFVAVAFDQGDAGIVRNKSETR
jgi:hypothetical protein